MRNPSHNLQTTPYKSQPCRLFQRNKCYRGENCRFSHTMTELNRNGVYKSRPCYWSFNGQDCPYPRCHFIHKDEMESFAGADANAMCYKTKLCDKWERYGQCRFGPKCIFAHGQQELQAQTKKLCLSKLETDTKEIQVKHNCWMNWSAEKIGRIYGDWIDCMDAI